jgi:hypothetical protein
MLPTYKRVANGKLPRFIDSAIKMAANKKNVCFTFLINKHDQETYDHIHYQPDIVKRCMIYENHKEPHLGNFYNILYEYTVFREPGTIVSMVGDDMEFITSGYDLAILNAINKCKGMGIVYCNDDFVQGRKLCVNLFTTRKLVETTNHPFMCEKFKAYFIDTVWMRVGQRMKILHYLDNVKIKHHHISANKKFIDETAQRLQKVKKSFNKGYKEVDRYVNGIVNNLKGVI